MPGLIDAPWPTMSVRPAPEEAISGAIGFFNDHGKMRRLSNEAQGASPRRVVLGLSRLAFIDSAGMCMRLILKEELSSTDKQLILRGAAGQVKRALSIAQLDQIIAIEA